MDRPPPLPPDIAAEHEILWQEHTELMVEYSHLRRNPGDRAGHRAYMVRLHAHQARLRVHIENLRADRERS
jgi:hypothetical protein